jgi:translation initiation factor IF-3
MVNNSRPGNYSKGKVYDSSAGFQLGQTAGASAPNKYGSQLGNSGNAASTTSTGNSTGIGTSNPSSAPRAYAGTSSSSAPRPYTGGSSAPRPYAGTSGTAPTSRSYAPAGGTRPYTPSTGARPYTPSTGGAGGYRPGGYAGGYQGSRPSTGGYRPGGYAGGGYQGNRPSTGGYGGGYNSGGYQGGYPKKRDDGPNRNYWIRAPKVLVIDDEGENLGEMETEKALAIAKERELDLVEVSPNANPPVCRIIDYSKYLYEQKKKTKSTKLASSKEMKELKFSPVIDEHDIEVRIKRANEFMDKGHNVRLTVEKKGRQTYEQVNVVMAKLLTYFEGYSTIETVPKTEGKKTYITFKSDGKTKNKKNIS